MAVQHLPPLAGALIIVVVVYFVIRNWGRDRLLDVGPCRVAPGQTTRFGQA